MFTIIVTLLLTTFVMCSTQTLDHFFNTDKIHSIKRQELSCPVIERKAEERYAPFKPLSNMESATNLCPWTWNLKRDETRIPEYVYVADCADWRFASLNLQCEPVMVDIPVIKQDASTCEVTATTETIAIACAARISATRRTSREPEIVYKIGENVYLLKTEEGQDEQ